MANTINTNIAAQQTQRALHERTNAVNKTFEHLSSGKRITRASDDPAGLAVALALLNESDTRAVASRNISDGVSAADIAEGALNSATMITGRMGELAEQASNGTLSDQQRSILNEEYQALRSELDRISQTTEFNGQQLLSGNQSISIQVGTDGSANSQINVSLPGVSGSGLGLATDITTQANARAALDETSGAVETLAAAAGSIGAAVSRLGSADANNRSAGLAERESASRILDADIASEAAKLTANRIGQQAAVAIQAQANLSSALVLRLLS